MSEASSLKQGTHCFVVTADQQDSRHQDDAVPAALDLLAEVPTTLPFERAAGDEIQGVLASGTDVVRTVGLLLRTGAWRVGIGIGTLETPSDPGADGGTPLPQPESSHDDPPRRSVREARGPAFIAARRAVERSHRAPWPVAVDANRSVDAAVPPAQAAPILHAEAALWLWAALLGRRTAEGWEVVDLRQQADSQKEVAQQLDVSPSAVSQRLRTAGWVEDQRGQELAASLLEAAWDSCATLSDGDDDARVTASERREEDA